MVTPDYSRTAYVIIKNIPRKRKPIAYLTSARRQRKRNKRKDYYVNKRPTTLRHLTVSKEKSDDPPRVEYASNGAKGSPCEGFSDFSRTAGLRAARKLC
jgi:hypothetical protein